MNNKYLKSFVLFFAALSLVLGSLTLAGCGGSSSSEQDNCYGEDMPVINE